MKFDYFLKAASNDMASNRYISLMLDLISAFLVGITAFLAIFSKQYNYMHNAGLIGVALTNIMRITSMISVTVR